ncbi:MAG: hypothetical protein M2R45_03181 [Verrucomicrobia subdivision 3 bacterium]|nr:hypothetical protein [Limisphaerales bacterium]MCS1417744.1 hypothetical protein [Limisphaerales bacterium]
MTIESPIPLNETTSLQAVTYGGRGRVLLERAGYCVRQNANAPSAPDIHLSDLKPVTARGLGHSYSDAAFRLEPFVNPPQDRSNRGEVLLLGERSMSVLSAFMQWINGVSISNRDSSALRYWWVSTER